jgi:hypothetical protein
MKRINKKRKKKLYNNSKPKIKRLMEKYFRKISLLLIYPILNYSLTTKILKDQEKKS